MCPGPALVNLDLSLASVGLPARLEHLWNVDDGSQLALS